MQIKAFIQLINARMIRIRRHVDSEKIRVPDGSHFFRVYVSPSIYVISWCCYFSVSMIRIVIFSPVSVIQVEVIFHRKNINDVKR